MSDSSLELTSMFLRTNTSDANAGIIQLKNKTITATITDTNFLDGGS